MSKYLLDEDGIIDEVAVERVLAGHYAVNTEPTRLTLSERLEVAKALALRGWDEDEIKVHMSRYAGVGA